MLTLQHNDLLLAQVLPGQHQREWLHGLLKRADGHSSLRLHAQSSRLKVFAENKLHHIRNRRYPNAYLHRPNRLLQHRAPQLQHCSTATFRKPRPDCQIWKRLRLQRTLLLNNRLVSGALQHHGFRHFKLPCENMHFLLALNCRDPEFLPDRVGNYPLHFVGHSNRFPQGP